ncbi:Potassium channel [Aspergillus wentii]|nr:Potassium channel [Aspergillus wentii]
MKILWALIDIPGLNDTIKGTLGPMASAFSICSLAQNWSRVPLRHEKNSSDPAWVVGVNAISLGVAIVANLVLLFSMARRISFIVAQPIIIIGWYISSLLLVAILAVFPASRDKEVRHDLSQAYFYGVFAAILYFIVSSLLLITTYGAHRGHYSREYKLTTNQRTLMLQTISFLVYLLGGAGVYAAIEDWDYLDAVYFADSTLLTIGFGNVVPKTHTGRGFLFPYAVGGILILGLIISSIRAQMLEKGRQKMAELITERTCRFLIKEASAKHSFVHHIIPPLDKDRPDESEREKRIREFKVMRQIRQIATLQRKWISLTISLSLWTIMWLFGALAFWASKKETKWTYFESLYFAYGALLTIGYGDFHPSTEWETSFFVFWTLLAVPTVTILIANVGDTVVRSIRDITIYIGALTILPGEKPVRELIRDIFQVSWKEKFLKETADEDSTQEPTEPERDQDQDRQRDRYRDAEVNLPYEEEVRNAIEADEHKKEESARARGDIAAEQIHHYHYLLFREVRRMIDYATRNLPKEFDFQEWEYFLNLIAGEGHPVAEAEEQNGCRSWSWADYKNPLLGEKTEVQWLLEALTEALERELRKASRGVHSPEQSGQSDGG